MKHQNTTLLAASLITLLTALPAFSAKENKDQDKPEPCSASKEYVTTMEFLRAQKTPIAPDKDARKIALQVAEGCNGAAGRFIGVTQILMTAGLIAPEAVEIGKEFAARSNDEAETFILVFKKAFTEKGLDLDIRSSIQMARSLTTEFKGNTKYARKDFETVLKYCISESKLDLPKPECGSMAARVARKGDVFEKGVSDDFLNLLEFLQSKSGANMATATALNLSEDVVSNGRGAADNFTQAFRYASSKSGMGLEINDALSFAKEMAARTKSKAATSKN